MATNKTFRECMKQALTNAIGSRPDYDIIIASGEWVKRGVFVEQDTIDLQAIIDERYNFSEMTESEV